MADGKTLLEGNLEFARRFDQGDLPIPPRMKTLILTCLDARIDPARLFGLELGDAFVIRNVGGRVTDEVVENIAIMWTLATVMGGTPALEVAIVHHTDCGTSRFTDPHARKTLSQAAGTSEARLERLAVTDPRTSVSEDIDRLKAASTLPDELVVSGYVYDVRSGRVDQTVAPAAREGDGEAP